MKRIVTEGAKRILLAGLGSLDSQTEEVRDLLRRGEQVLGFSQVENEELSWNGNRKKDDRTGDETDGV